MDGDRFSPTALLLLPTLASPAALALGETALGETAPGETAPGETAPGEPDMAADWPGASAHRRPGAAGGAGSFLGRDLNDHALRRPAPVFDAQALAAARRAGFAAGQAAGLQAGLDAAAGARAAAEAAALGLIAAALADAQVQAQAVADQAAAALARLLVAALHAAMPELIRRSALGEARAMLAQVLPGLSREAQVGVVVASSLAPGVAAAVGRLAPESRDRIAVSGLDDLPCGEVRVRWACGQALRQPGPLWRAVMDVLEPALAPELVTPAQVVADFAEPAFKDTDDGQ